MAFSSATLDHITSTGKNHHHGFVNGCLKKSLLMKRLNVLKAIM